MSDIRPFINLVWITTWALVALAMFPRGRKAFERIGQTETTMERWAFRMILSQYLVVSLLHFVGILDFDWWAISAFGIAGYMSYRSLRLILLKEKAREAT